jgi:hypothetical protein
MPTEQPKEHGQSVSTDINESEYGEEIKELVIDSQDSLYATNKNEYNDQGNLLINPDQ